ncbi:hypothetical protein [Methanoculleus chikugoensis]|uniref:hypothetical protein n=1 Tax=Methanoculleus chikugoensis TaxID=118126 RepID=UPI000AF79952|nr:hypothetical protein [Methanoculleus chikugoensis]
MIDDGCTDNTAKVARDAGRPSSLTGQKGGKGQGGIKSALKYAVDHDYDCLVFMDGGDGQHDPGGRYLSWSSRSAPMPPISSSDFGPSPRCRFTGGSAGRCLMSSPATEVR